MMEFVLQWMTGAVISGVAVSVITAIMPKGSTEKTIKIIAAVFLLAEVCSPIKNITKLDFEDTFSYAENMEKGEAEINKTVEKMMQNAVEGMIKTFLDDNDIHDYKAEAEMYIDEDNCINIQEIKITLPKEYSGKIDDIEEKLRSITGASITVEAPLNTAETN